MSQIAFDQLKHLATLLTRTERARLAAWLEESLEPYSKFSGFPRHVFFMVYADLMPPHGGRH